MYDIRQFKPALYLVLLLGFTGFAMAAESLGLGLFCLMAWGVNAWLVWSGRFIPLPRWLAGGITILALFYVIAQMRTQGGPPLMFIGLFLVLLQVIKLFEQRANRDYAQLLILSLLLVVAASINTASLLFGLLLMVYMVLALYSCLLFHLKVEADRARAAFPVPPDQVNSATLQLDTEFLPRSMRRLTVLVALTSVSAAVAVFLLFPRGPGQGVLGQLQFKPSTALTGFSEKVSFDQISRIKQNDEVVAHVTVWRDGRLLQGTEPLLLRGLTLDTYGPDPQRGFRYQWSRTRARGAEQEIPEDGQLNDDTHALSLYRQRVQLYPTGTRYLFAMPGPVHFKTQRVLSVRYAPADESFQTEPMILPIEYEVTSTGEPTPPAARAAFDQHFVMTMPSSDRAVLDQVRQIALLPEVTGGLAANRPRYPDRIDESNEAIARAIETYLRFNFTYTLDLTGSRDLLRETDPVVAFLTTVRKGHCEYFASAMTLMCQSIGIPARVVVGFRCDEYNAVGQYYVVRQAHAHTWVEVLTPRGWVQFDPTSGRDETQQRAAGFWQSMRQLVDFLEYKWAENVVAYNNRSRENLIRQMDDAMTNTAMDIGDHVMAMRRRLDELLETSSFWKASGTLITALIAVMVTVVVFFTGLYLAQRYRLRRRAHRIGLDALPREQQVRLVRQLAFFDLLMRVLQRHRISRPAHQTPREFADSLVFLPGEAYDAIRRLTRLFYRVRFGEAELAPHRQRRLETVVLRVAELLSSSLQR